MKVIAAIAAIVCILSCSMWIFFRFGDDTKFSRTIEDLQLRTEEFKKYNGITDPWGNKYKVVSATSGTKSFEYAMSLGPDGRSDSLGHDADDITRWTDRSSWLDSLHPIFIVRLLFVISILLFVSSISFHFGRLKEINQRSTTSRAT